MATGDDMVVINGIRYRAEDAERLGLAPATRPADTPESTESGTGSGADSPGGQKARTPRNKARTPRNKARDG